VGPTRLALVALEDRELSLFGTWCEYMVMV
jgi:hypothetical protein